MDAESFTYTDRQTTDNYRHARSDKGEAAYGLALKKRSRPIPRGSNSGCYAAFRVTIAL